MTTPRPARLLAAAAALTAAATGLAACAGTIPLRPTGASPPVTVAPRATDPGATSPTTTSPGASSPTTTTPGKKRGSPTKPPAKVSLPPISGRHPGLTLYRKALADAAAEHWVHGTATVPGQTAGEPTTHFISDDGPGRGTQDITIGPLRGDIRVLGDRTWIHGTAETLAGLFGVPAQSAEALGGHWVTLRSGDSEYSSVTAGVTIASFLGEVAFRGPLTAGTAVLDGSPRTVVEGRLAPSAGTGDGVLYLTTGSRPLPLLWDQIGADGTARSTFSDWGHAVGVTAPAGAVALPTVPGGATSAALLRPAGTGAAPAPARLRAEPAAASHARRSVA